MMSDGEIGKPICGQAVDLLDTPSVGDKDVTPMKVLSMIEQELISKERWAAHLNPTRSFYVGRAWDAMAPLVSASWPRGQGGREGHANPREVGEAQDGLC